MFHVNFFILLVILYSSVSAKIYTESEITSVVDNSDMEMLTKTFVRGFFVSQYPEKYIDDFLLDKKQVTDTLLKEYQLNILLNEISYHPKQLFLQDFVDKMKQYDNQSFKVHEEGRVPVVVFNIQARAHGIENIWLATASVNHYSYLFNKDPLIAISEVKNNLALLSAPEWLGLKNSIHTISAENHIKLQNYLLEDIEHLSGLDKFISHYALLTGSKELVDLGLLNFDKSNSEYILRSLSHYFTEDFVTQKLISTVKNNRNQAFAMSMMAPYIDSYASINDLLFEYLSDKQLSDNAAFVLSTTKDEGTLYKLLDAYEASRSDREKKQIIFALKMNKLNESDVVLSHLVKNSNDKARVWLKSLSGETK